MSAAGLARATVAIAALLLGTVAAAPAEPLRHLEYRVSFGIDGPPRVGSVQLDLVSTGGDGAVTVDVSEVIHNGDDRIVRVDIDRGGTLRTVLNDTLSSPQHALLAILALESENMHGVDLGDNWTRETGVPGGRASTRFRVTKNDGRGHVALAITCTIEFASGDQTSWRGTANYDTNTFVPTAIVLTGSSVDDGRRHTFSLNLRLVEDTFSKPVLPPDTRRQVGV